MKFLAPLRVLLVALPSLLSTPVFAQTPLRKPPIMVPDAKVMQLDSLGLYQLSYMRRGEAEQFYSTGWFGDFDEATGVACQPRAEQNGRRAWLLHPPWRGGPTGFSRQSFTFALPKARHIELRGAFAMQSDNTQGSDGVTFRVKVGNVTLLDENTKSTQWRDFSFDLTRYAGSNTTIAFESDAGPQNNSSFDFALWGERQLVLGGFNPAPTAHYPPIPLPLPQVTTSAGKIANTDVAPQGGYIGRHLLTLSSAGATLGYAGADGTFDYRWTPPRNNEEPPLGTLELKAREKTPQGRLAPLIHVNLADDARIEWISGAQMKRQSSQFQISDRAVTLVSRYTGNGKSATLRMRATLVGKSLVLDTTCDSPLVRSFSAGQWGPVMRRKPILVPYYLSDGQVYFLSKQNLFVNAFNDWTASNASYIDESHRAIYNALTDGRTNALRERAIFAPGWHMSEVLPNIPNASSPYLREVGGKVVLDIWGDQYLDIAKQLKQYHDYGLRSLIAIVHVWQREGYDNALPAHYPARTEFGGDEGMKTLAQTAARLGYRIALHENYVDYYPNYEHFDANDISLRSDGTRETAWYNEGTKVQSFAEKPTAILRIAGTQSPEIHRRYGTNANYLDVHSAVPPWFHVDQRAGEAGAGKFSTVFQAHKQLWAFERTTHAGPTFGEGNKHWFWSGLLDGAEAQVQDGWNVPLLVDFDLLKIHPLESNHGMGYYERWWSESNWNGLPPMQVLDRYRMQTLAFGHAGFLGAGTWRDLRLAWQEHNLITPVTSRYAMARPVEIAYWQNGKWTGSSSVVRASGSFDRVHVRYDNGLVLTCNNSALPFTVSGAMLPQYGWSATGAGLTAYTALRDGLVVDFAQTSLSTFANARSSTTWNLNSEARTRVKVTDFAQTGPRQFRLNYQWSVGDTYPAEYRAFVHFSQPTQQNASAIVFQDDHTLPTPTNTWKAGSTIEDGPRTITIPANVKDGDYPISIGLFNDKGRAPLGGDMDSSGRARLGTLQIRNDGQQLTFVPPTDQGEARRRLYAMNINSPNKPVDFGSVRTDGSVMIRRDKNEWVMQTLPREQKFVVQLSASRFGRPATVRAMGATTTVLKTKQATDGRWQIDLNGAREYRWKITH